MGTLQKPAALRRRFAKRGAAAAAPASITQREASADDVSGDIDTILASTEKILAVNKGLAEPDERDSWQFRKVFTPDKLLAERIIMDAGRIRQITMRRLAKARSLKPIGTGHFDDYSTGLLIGHQLSSPGEEINPMSLVEQQRRISAMGPGGLSSSESITSEAQNIHPSSFGFIDAIAGPESEKAGVDVRAAHGTKIGDNGLIYQKFVNKRTGKKEWLSPVDTADKVIGLPE